MTIFVTLAGVSPQLTRSTGWHALCMSLSNRGNVPGGGTTMTKQMKRTLQAMRAASRRGVDPYDSQPVQAAMYRCIWRLVR